MSIIFPAQELSVAILTDRKDTEGFTLEDEVVIRGGMGIFSVSMPIPHAQGLAVALFKGLEEYEANNKDETST